MRSRLYNLTDADVDMIEELLIQEREMCEGVIESEDYADEEEKETFEIRARRCASLEEMFGEIRMRS